MFLYTETAYQSECSSTCLGCARSVSELGAFSVNLTSFILFYVLRRPSFLTPSADLRHFFSSGERCRKTSRGVYHWRELPKVSFLSRQRQNTSFVATKVCLPHLSRQNRLLRQNITRVCRDNYILCLSRHLHFVATNMIFCDKSFVVASILLSRQKYACRDKSMLATFVATKVFLPHLSRQNRLLRQNITRVCRDNYILCLSRHLHFVATNMIFCDKSFVVASILLSRQKYACRDKSMLAAFVATKVFLPHLSRQNRLLRQNITRVCRDNYILCLSRHLHFVATNMIFCDKSFVVASILLSRQRYACRDKSMLATFVATKVFLPHLSRQNRLLRQNITRVCRDNYILCLSRHLHFVATNMIFCDKSFVVASILLLRQKTCFVTKNSQTDRQRQRDIKSFCFTVLPLIIIQLLFQTAGDIHLNPGPPCPKSYQ